ncbi:MAG: hypothetical protein OEO20_08245 [Gemmatimonadota bacterium]|nr:hypothetical protein [Gemmatimonadota bacterium]MDH3367968.1 hypothetical protein [Gemmatimonadota bacterium]MDH3478277.1 hypothetical protein [Gemmatimonadota bacterium]MDH3570662.1 hypothetical protein [Gemmatimonadota bacterium]MDH5551395.1 hypothetical protein [Gemmatimonadota bacterium]
MAERTIRLTGWKALAALVVLAGFVGYRYSAMRATLATEAADELRMWLAAEYQAAGLPELERALAAGDRAAAERSAAEIIARDRISFVDLRARGKPDDLVVRAEIAVDGRPPPVGGAIRYFRMRYSTVSGWRLVRETTVLSYLLRIF